jgi:hypothetical protein
MRPINRFLLENGLPISPATRASARTSASTGRPWRRGSRTGRRGVSSGIPSPVSTRPRDPGRSSRTSRAATARGALSLRARRPRQRSSRREGAAGRGIACFPATWENLLRLKNLVQEHDAGSTIFPSAAGDLGGSTLGIGARFTTLHWPAVEWAMSALELGSRRTRTASPASSSTTSTPCSRAGSARSRSLHRDERARGPPGPERGGDEPRVRAVEAEDGLPPAPDRLELQRRPPAGRRRVRRPRGRARRDGCLLASYITFDLSPELARRSREAGRDRPGPGGQGARAGRRRGLALEDAAFGGLMCTVWPAVEKMKRRDEKYREARREGFHDGSRPALPARALDRRAARAHRPGDDRRHAGALRGARDAGQLHRAGVRLPEEHAVSRQRGAALPGRAAVGRGPAFRRQHRLPLGLGQVGRELPGRWAR